MSAAKEISMIAAIAAVLPELDHIFTLKESGLRGYVSLNCFFLFIYFIACCFLSCFEFIALLLFRYCLTFPCTTYCNVLLDDDPLKNEMMHLSEFILANFEINKK